MHNVQKQYIFWFHYNKPKSRLSQSPKMTIHYKGACHIVDHINCNVFIKTHHRNSQPHIVIKGKANSIELKKENNFVVAYVN
jgi:hypothetical protein